MAKDDGEDGLNPPTDFRPLSTVFHDLAPGDATQLRRLSLRDPNEPGLQVQPPDGPPALPSGFLYEGLLGRGAMGEVHRVRDLALNRSVAMKVLQSRFNARRVSAQRFMDEAQASSQLQHPGIVPVHQLGTLPDGRLYFTMQEVRGRTLSEVIRELHGDSGPHTFPPTASGLSLRRLIDMFRMACEAVAYAHRRGVVHRDLKPENVMVGAHGEVQVMDWGLAKLVGRPDRAEALQDDDEQPEEDVVVTGRAEATRVGMVFGTPAYMPPEQAQGRTDALDTRTDVYALGAILFCILYGERPYAGLSSRSLLGRVASAIPPAVPLGGEMRVPPELERIRQRAMSMDPTHRHSDAGRLADDILAWLDGAARRERAQALVAEATQLGPAAIAQRQRAERTREEGRRALEAVPAWSAESEKRHAWALLDQADRLEADADLLEVEAEQLLQGALAHDPDSLEARESLAERWRTLHARAEQQRDVVAARRAEALLRGHVQALPVESDARTRHEHWLHGTAYITVRTERPVQVSLERYAVDGRRLVCLPVERLGTTPLADIEVPHGSYRLVLHVGKTDVYVPVHLARGDRFEPVDAHGRPDVMALPEPDDLDPDDVYVAEGWTALGGDPSAIGSGPARNVWVPAFILKRHPVTNREYLAFLDDLVRQGREDEALQLAPRERSGTVGEAGAQNYGRHPDGTFHLREDAHGDLWLPEWPVINVDWTCAGAFAAWMAARTGKPWRLPRSDEWEKAGRGADRRAYPWGDHLDPSHCCMRDSHPGHPDPAPVDAFPLDESPYGVRGLAGNVRDWCSDAVADGRRINRGGFWLGNAREARLADQHEHAPEHRAAEIGIRLARDARVARPGSSPSDPPTISKG